MEIRRLVKSGLSSHVIAIPKEFIEANKLKKGDLLNIENKGVNELVISVGQKPITKERTQTTISIEGKDRITLAREINSAYLDNYTHIVIVGENLINRTKEIKQQIKDLVGLEVVEESSNHIIARDFVNIGDVSVEGLLRRMDNIVRSMLSELPDSFENHELPQIFIERDYETNRLNFLVYKILKTSAKDVNLARELNLFPLKILAFWELNMHIEKMGDECKRMSRYLTKIKATNKEKEEIKALCRMVEDTYKEILKSFYLKNLKLSDQTYLKLKTKDLDVLEKYLVKSKNPLVSEIIGKFKAMLSHLSDVTRLVRYL